ncbi:hypothetical protein HOLleu_02784 [Holothuria leucospilota]|uniref:Methyltransferase type 11 domain-containing protein n=1 Tax=Holothuria leucospilota TaxID=206669 RepID=A0A9Q1HJY6_HOLLE|nr:hypothetical protein HOLleu_02784 [Holothuria leucospilota]
MESSYAEERKKLYQAIIEDPTGIRSQEWYTKNAELYEQQHKNHDFMYHKECMEIFKKTVSQKDCKVIDFAMGTGVMGEMLRKMASKQQTGPREHKDRRREAPKTPLSISARSNEDAGRSRRQRHLLLLSSSKEGNVRKSFSKKSLTRQLRNEGYTGQLDGMDRNPSMLKFAKAKGIYTNIWTVDIGPEKIKEIDDDSYDNGVVAGSVGRGQVEFNSLSTMIRAIKTGGYLFITMSQFHTQYEEFTIKALENLCDKWNAEGLCHLVQCVEGMHTSTAGGYVFVLRRGSKEQ